MQVAQKGILSLAAVLLVVGCGSEPAPEAPKKKVPQPMNGQTVVTTTSEGTVYASQKENYLIRCQNGDGQGCRDISTLYEKGFGAAKDMQKALYYVERGCELGHGSSCNRAGNFYDHGYAGVVDKQKAASYYMKGCELNNGTACNNIGNSYMDGAGVVKNLDLAETYLQKAIRIGSNAYNNLGYLYEMKGDLQKAESYYIQGCERKDPTACSNLGYLYQKEKKFTAAYNQFIKACNLAHGSACHAASMMIYNKQVQVASPSSEMFKLDSNSCELNSPVGCADLAYDYTVGIGTAKSKKEAKRYYQKACKLGHKGSCEKLKTL